MNIKRRGIVISADFFPTLATPKNVAPEVLHRVDTSSLSLDSTAVPELDSEDSSDMFVCRDISLLNNVVNQLAMEAQKFVKLFQDALTIHASLAASTAEKSNNFTDPYSDKIVQSSKDITASPKETQLISATSALKLQWSAMRILLISLAGTVQSFNKELKPLINSLDEVLSDQSASFQIEQISLHFPFYVLKILSTAKKGIRRQLDLLEKRVTEDQMRKSLLVIGGTSLRSETKMESMFTHDFNLYSGQESVTPPFADYEDQSKVDSPASFSLSPWLQSSISNGPGDRFSKRSMSGYSSPLSKMLLESQTTGTPKKPALADSVTLTAVPELPSPTRTIIPGADSASIASTEIDTPGGPAKSQVDIRRKYSEIYSTTSSAFPQSELSQVERTTPSTIPMTPSVRSPTASLSEKEAQWVEQALNIGEQSNMTALGAHELLWDGYRNSTAAASFPELYPSQLTDMLLNSTALANRRAKRSHLSDSPTSLTSPSTIFPGSQSDVVHDVDERIDSTLGGEVTSPLAKSVSVDHLNQYLNQASLPTTSLMSSSQATTTPSGKDGVGVHLRDTLIASVPLRQQSLSSSIKKTQIQQTNDSHNDNSLQHTEDDRADYESYSATSQPVSHRLSIHTTSTTGKSEGGSSSTSARSHVVPHIILLPLNGRSDMNYIDLSESAYFGRSSSSDGEKKHFKVFPTMAVSRKHAEVFCIKDQVYIRDLGSTLGTYVNGLRLSNPKEQSPAIEIRSGDYIQLGISLPSTSEDSATPSQPLDPSAVTPVIDTATKDSISTNVISSVSSPYNMKGLPRANFANQTPTSAGSSVYGGKTLLRKSFSSAPHSNLGSPSPIINPDAHTLEDDVHEPRRCVKLQVLVMPGLLRNYMETNSMHTNSMISHSGERSPWTKTGSPWSKTGSPAEYFPSRSQRPDHLKIVTHPFPNAIPSILSAPILAENTPPPQSADSYKELMRKITEQQHKMHLLVTDPPASASNQSEKSQHQRFSTALTSSLPMTIGLPKTPVSSTSGPNTSSPATNTSPGWLRSPLTTSALDSTTTAPSGGSTSGKVGKSRLSWTSKSGIGVPGAQGNLSSPVTLMPTNQSGLRTSFLISSTIAGNRAKKSSILVCEYGGHRSTIDIDLKKWESASHGDGGETDSGVTTNRSFSIAGDLQQMKFIIVKKTVFAKSNQEEDSNANTASEKTKTTGTNNIAAASGGEQVLIGEGFGKNLVKKSVRENKYISEVAMEEEDLTEAEDQLLLAALVLAQVLEN
ncbi:hypothetical protein HDU76_002400 [Blyttiomyces sp. JEL0837]|nr:hypothetical protein HDU76_002400 [Blyttiomyces sp. JEL0837]